MKKVLKYFKPNQELSFFNNIKVEFLIYIVFIGILISSISVVQELIFIERSKASNISLVSSFITILFMFTFLFILKTKNIKFSGNTFSLSLVVILLITMNILDEDVSAMYKYIDSFYVILALLSVSVLYASRSILIINAILIVASTYRVLLFALAHSPEKSEYFKFGFISHTIALLIITFMIYFEKKFTNQTIKKAEQEAVNKELKNQELQASEEEIRASMEELKTTTDALSETNDELTVAKGKAEESDRLKTVFLSNMSHEVRTPLNGIIGFANLLKTKEHVDIRDKYYADIISKSGEQLLKIIDDLIEISQLETEQAKVYKKILDIDRLLNDIINDFNPIVSQKGIKLFIDEDCKNTGLDTIGTDEAKLRSILKQLVDNAIKFTSKGFVKLKYYQEGKDIVFEIKDSGIGFEKKNAQNIFDRFMQANEKIAIDFGGLGLGLTIAKLNVESLGGQMFVESESGKGSIFRFKIPDKSI